MGTYALGSVFAPASVALVGGSPRERSLGRLVLRQVIDGGFHGRIGVVNRNYPEIEGVANAERVAARVGCARQIRLVGPFGRGTAADRRRHYAPEKPGAWPPFFPEDPIRGTTPHVLKVDQARCFASAAAGASIR